MAVSQNNQYNMKKFEYKVLTFGYGMIPDEKRLNELGQSGWELTGRGSYDDDHDNQHLYLYRELLRNRLYLRYRFPMDKES